MPPKPRQNPAPDVVPDSLPPADQPDLVPERRPPAETPDSLPPPDDSPAGRDRVVDAS